jgi:hypothetical protein
VEKNLRCKGQKADRQIDAGEDARLRAGTVDRRGHDIGLLEIGRGVSPEGISYRGQPRPEFKARVAVCYQAPSRTIARELATRIRVDYAATLPSAVSCFLTLNTRQNSPHQADHPTLAFPANPRLDPPYLRPSVFDPEPLSRV